MAGIARSITTGTVFGRLTVTGAGAGRRRKANGESLAYTSATSLCHCECGGTADVPNSSLKNGDSTSCGCKCPDRGGASKLPEYFTWKKMISRCHNPNDPSYLNYGGRGITVCQEWKDSIKRFRADVGAKPSPIHTIDRLDNSKGYEKGNVKWSTPTEQQNNRRCNRLIEFEGQIRTLAQWAFCIGMSAATLEARLDLYGWSTKDAFTVLPDKRNKGIGTRSRRCQKD